MTTLSSRLAKIDVEKLCLRVVALIGINILAFAYDSSWLYVAVAIDAATLGYTLKDGVRKSDCSNIR